MTIPPVSGTPFIKTPAADKKEGPAEAQPASAGKGADSVFLSSEALARLKAEDDARDLAKGTRDLLARDPSALGLDPARS